jgi:chromosome segregation ATPase
LSLSVTHSLASTNALTPSRANERRELRRLQVDVAEQAKVITDLQRQVAQQQGLEVALTIAQEELTERDAMVDELLAADRPKSKDARRIEDRSDGQRGSEDGIEIRGELHTTLEATLAAVQEELEEKDEMIGRRDHALAALRHDMRILQQAAAEDQQDLERALQIEEDLRHRIGDKLEALTLGGGGGGEGFADGAFVSELMARVALLEGELVQLRDKEANQEDELVQLRDKEANQEDELVQLRDKGATQEDELVQLRDKGATQEDELVQLRDKGANQEDELVQLRDKGATQEDELVQLRDNVANQEDELVQLRDKGATQEDELVQLRDKRANQEDELVQLRDKRANQEDELVQLRDKGANQEDELEELVQLGANQGEELVQLRALLEAAQDAAGPKQDERENAGKETAAMQSQVIYMGSLMCSVVSGPQSLM